MPKLYMFFDPSKLPLTVEQKLSIGRQCQPLVAAATSTKGQVYNPDTAIDFFPYAYPKGTIVDCPIEFVIKTAHTPEKAAKLTVVVVAQLSEDILAILRQIPVFGPNFNSRQLLVIDYFHDRSVHV